MATWKPEIHDIDGIIGWFDQYDYPNYRIFAGHKVDDNFCRAEYTDGSKAIGREKLLEALITIKSNSQNTNTYLITLLAAYNKKVNKGVTPSMTFQLNTPQFLQQYSPYGIMQQQPNNEVLSRLAAIEQRLSEDEEDEEDDTIQNNGISGILSSPEMQTALIGLITSYLSPKDNKPSAIAGVNTDDDLWNEARKILMGAGVTGEDIMLLARMSEDNKTQFTMLLKMLRK